MSADGDNELKRFVETGSEGAFAAVVEAYGGMVYGVAVRRAGDGALAEEVVQNVFVLLAKKAEGLVGRPGLGAWLHRAAVLESKNFVRGELNRRKKMEAYRKELERIELLSDEKAERLRPILDELLDGLREEERDVLMMHYFEGCGFREIGERTGRTEAAVQKQGRRALEKLSGVLKVRGVGVPVVVLGAVLIREMGSGMPVGLGAAVTKVAVGGAAGGGGLLALVKAMTMTKPLVGAGAVLLLALVPLAVQSGRIGELEGRASELRERPVVAPVVGGGGGSVGATAVGKSVGRRDGWDGVPTAGVLAEAFLRSDPKVLSLYSAGPSHGEVMGLMEAMDVEAQWEILRGVGELEMGGGVKWLIEEALVEEVLSKSDPEGALDYALEMGMRDSVFRAAMALWATEDFGAAWEWLAGKRAAGEVLRKRLDGKGPEVVLLEAFASGLAEADLDEAVEFARGLAGSEDGGMLVAGVAKKLLAGREHGRFFDLVGAMPEGGAKDEVLVGYAADLAGLMEYLPMRGLAETRELFGLEGFPERLRMDAVKQAVRGIGVGHERCDPAFLAVYALGDEAWRGEVMVWLVGEMEALPGVVSGRWIPGEAEVKALREEAFVELVGELAERGEMRQARRYAEKIIDDGKRAEVLGAIEGGAAE